MTKEERIILIEEARIMGVKSITIDGVTYEFKEEETPVTRDSVDPEALLKVLSPEPEYTDEEILFWSTPTFDEIQEQKELRNKQLKEGLING